MARIIGVLLIVLLAGCNNKDKPKETTQDKKISSDTICKPVVIDTNNTKVSINTNKTKDVSVKRDSLNKVAKLPQTQLSRVVFITTSEGCHCTLSRCSEGEKTVSEVVQQFSKQLVFEKLDYAKEHDQVTKLAQEYQLYNLPALLFFDNIGKFNGKLEISWNEEAIKEKLMNAGVK